MQITSKNPEQFLKLFFFKAYNASRVVGMGYMQARDNVTADQVFECVKPLPGDSTYHADYVYGRMMKLTAKVDGNTITISDDQPRPDYQSWCRTYPTYAKLAEAVALDL